MAGFIFETDLPHQSQAVEAVADVFDSVGFTSASTPTQNNLLRVADSITTLKTNIRNIQKRNELGEKVNIGNIDELIFDVSMETGTGKTYTYTKTIFELNKRFGLSKFIVTVPRVAIKANTVGFLNSEAAREHFKLAFGKQLKVYEVQSQKKGKAKKEFMPQSILEFCRADSNLSKNVIHVLVINAGMINSPTMSKKFDVALFDQYSVAYDAIAHTSPILIIDEPHLFKTDNKTFENIRKFRAQFTLRYGATFDGQYENLLYNLNAVDAFNQDLVKGIVAHIEKFDEADNTTLKLLNLDEHEATFELVNNGTRKSFKLTKQDSLELVHSAMSSLYIDTFNKSKLLLSNGLELKKGDVINPYSYAETLQNKMLQQAIVRHFEIEKDLLSNNPRIKPLSLFFIDNIDSYRDKDGAMRLHFEKSVRAHLTYLIKKEADGFYKEHLLKALANIESTHGGYFSKDNSDKDEAIEQETLEILHDKEALLDLNNPRRFIFSKWTLREGWDNPNIFQICKLRSSGSETSKLQEVGRGLRLPVNEYMSRVKDKSYDLHYYVDFTESDFVKKLTDEINRKSGSDFDETKLSDNLITAILKYYPQFSNDEDLLVSLDDDGIINRKNEYKVDGFAKLKALYPLAFTGGLKSNKIKSAGTSKQKVTIRQGKYEELRILWETINQKVVLEYKLDDTNNFKVLFKDYLSSNKQSFIEAGSMSQQQRIVVDNNKVTYRIEDTIENEILPFRMMSYKTFITTLSKEIALGISMLHEVFNELLREKVLDINPYMSLPTIREIKTGFNNYLMSNVFGKYQIGFKKTTNSIHPTAFTDETGKALVDIDSSSVGVLSNKETPPDNYLFNEIYFDDPELELNNIKTKISEVIVYSKIPKNSIKIPLVGSNSYSPDFAYVIKTDEGKTQLNLLIESKNKSQNNLMISEDKKIKHAEIFFNQIKDDIKITFATQLENKKIIDLIKDAIK